MLPRRIIVLLPDANPRFFWDRWLSSVHVVEQRAATRTAHGRDWEAVGVTEVDHVRGRAVDEVVITSPRVAGELIDEAVRRLQVASSVAA